MSPRSSWSEAALAARARSPGAWAVGDGPFRDGQDDRCERRIESQQQRQPVGDRREVAPSQVVLRLLELVGRLAARLELAAVGGITGVPGGAHPGCGARPGGARVIGRRPAMVRAVGHVPASGSATSLATDEQAPAPGIAAPASIQAAAPTGHTVLRGSPANSRSMPSPTRCWTSIARCRASRMRPSRSACSATMSLRDRLVAAGARDGPRRPPRHPRGHRSASVSPRGPRVPPGRAFRRPPSAPAPHAPA